MSSSVGPSRVKRPRRSSASTSNGSTASSTGTADGARIGVSTEVLVSGDCEIMAPYLGSAGGNRKGAHTLSSSPRKRGPITTDGCCCIGRRLQLLQITYAGGYGSRLALRLAGTTIFFTGD